MPHSPNNTLTDADIRAWLREREANAVLIANVTGSMNRDKFLEDAMYFREAGRAIEHYREAYRRKIDEVALLVRAVDASWEG